MRQTRQLAWLLAAIGIFLHDSAFSQEADAGAVAHGASLFGSLKYPIDFPHYDYVNPDAPKGGRIRIVAAAGSFDSFNPYIVQGTPAVPWTSLLYDTLLVDAYDEPSTMYGLLAESVEMPDDYSWVIYTLRADAQFSDGTPVSSADVVFSLELLREQGAPIYRFYYQNIVSAEALNDRQIKFAFDETGNRELPLITGQLTVFPKHYWEGVTERGEPRNFSRSSLVPPLGSGPYRIGRYEAGRFVEFERRADYWARDLPVNVGQYNFDIIRVDYYRDDDIALQAFFSDEFDLRLENVARNWATAYDRPPVRNGSIKLEEMPYVVPVTAQAYILNLRREKFSDPRVRQALGLAFNFEWVNENIFYGQYERVRSYWNNSELASSGLPSPAELALLEPFRDQLPVEVFTTEYSPPVSDGTETNRNNLFRALQLLQEAGWQLSNGRLVDSAGNPFEIEFLTNAPTQERIIQPYLRDLEKLGIRGSIRLADAAQYTERVQNGDFDVFTFVHSNSLSPGNEQREYWGSASADQPGSRNYGGVKNPVVDALIEEIIFAPNREALLTATHALDRVLLWNHYAIPAWTATAHRYAYWDRFGRPAELAKYHPGNSLLSAIPLLWWSREAGR
jgi:microcin C transport system substrate-binding protein